MWIKDTAERVVRTFLQAWLGAWVVIEDVTLDQLFDADVLAVGAVAAVGAILAALGGRAVGNQESASVLG